MYYVIERLKTLILQEKTHLERVLHISKFAFFGLMIVHLSVHW